MFASRPGRSPGRVTPTPDADAGALFRPGPVPADEVVTPSEPPGRSRIGPVICVVLGLLAVARVAGAAARLPPLPVESRLVDGAYAMLSGLPVPDTGPDEIAARLQLAAHAALTGAFGRHPDVLGGAREFAVLAFVVLLGAVAAVVRPTVRPWAFAVLLASFAVVEPAVTAVATFGPGLLGAMWLVLGAALLARRAGPVRVAGAVAVVAGVVTAPLLVVAVVVVIATRNLSTILRGVLVLAGLGLLVALPGDTARPLLVAAVLVVGTIVVDDLRPRGGAVAAAAGIGLAVVVLPTAWAAGTGRPHRELAEWISTVAAPDTVLAVPPGVWSDLVRDGVPAARLGPDGALVVTGGTSTAYLARFGVGETRLTVDLAVPGAAIPENATRARVGAQLDANPALDAPDDVRALLRSGGVDARALVVLGGLAGRGDVSITALPVVAGEDPARPRHRVVLDGAATVTVEWLRAQQEPFAPQVTVGRDGLTLTWPLPAPNSVFGR